MKPVVDGLQQEYQGKVDFVLINADKATTEQKQLMNQLGITMVPSFVFLNKNGTLAKKLVGETKADAMRAQLNTLK